MKIYSPGGRFEVLPLAIFTIIAALSSAGPETTTWMPSAGSGASAIHIVIPGSRLTMLPDVVPSENSTEGLPGSKSTTLKIPSPSLSGGV